MRRRRRDKQGDHALVMASAVILPLKGKAKGQAIIAKGWIAVFKGLN